MDAQAAKEQKSQLRKLALQARSLLSEGDRNTAAQALVRHFTSVLQQPHTHAGFARIANGGMVSGFWPIRSEIDPLSLMRALEKAGANLCLPAVLNATTIEFRAMSFEDALVETGFGTYGPAAGAPVVEPEIILVPLAAFDARGHRIGYGAGYYDRAIATIHQKNRFPLLIGVAFDVQRVDHIANEPHDVALDYILTESGLHSAGIQQ